MNEFFLISFILLSALKTRHCIFYTHIVFCVHHKCSVEENRMIRSPPFSSHPMLDSDPRSALLVEAYMRYGAEIFRHCQRQVQDREVAEDMTQEAFMRTFEYLRDGRHIENIRAFLYRVASNLIIDEWRRRGRANTVSLEELTEKGFDVGQEPSNEAHEQIDAEHAMKGLEQEEVKLLSMRYIMGLPMADIAVSLNMTANAVAVRLHRVTKRIAHSFMFRQQLRVYPLQKP